MQTELSELTEQEVREYMLININQQRKKHGLKPLERDAELEQFAASFAAEQDQTSWQEFPDPHKNQYGEDFIMRLRKTSLGKRIKPHETKTKIIYPLGENLISTNFGTIEKMMEAFMDSPKHKANLLNPLVTKVGIGYHQGSSILIQVFADLETANQQK